MTGSTCELCNSQITLSSSNFLCDCSYNRDRVVQCRGCCINCDNEISINYLNNIKIANSHIQNQVGVSQSLKNTVLSSITISNNLKSCGNDILSSHIWGHPNNLRNQSDRCEPHFDGNMNNNIPTRGSSTKTSITSNRPGSMNPGGIGVDVKHGSYARYLGKLKARNIF